MLNFVFTVWLGLALTVCILMFLKGCVVQNYQYEVAFSDVGRATVLPILILCAITLIPIVWEDKHPDLTDVLSYTKQYRNIFP